MPAAVTCEQVVLRPAKLLTADLSPTRLWRDVTGQGDLTVLSRAGGMQLLEGLTDVGPVPPGVTATKGGWRAAEVNLTLVGHFLTADLLRAGGRDFWRGLQAQGLAGRRRVVVRSRRLLQLVEEGRRRPDAVLEFFFRDGVLYAARVQTRDTMLPYGPGALTP